MRNIRHNQEAGFSHVLIVLILLVLAGVGLAGYRVWSSSKDKSSTATSPSSVAATEASTVPDGWKSVTEPCSKLTFSVPKDWVTTEEAGVTFDEARCGAYSATSADGNVLSWTGSFYGDGPSNCEDFEQPANCPSVEVIKLSKMPSGAGALKDLYVAKTRSCYPSTDSCAGFVFLFQAKNGVTPKQGTSYKMPESQTDFQPSLVNLIAKELVKEGKTLAEGSTKNESYIAFSMSQYKSSSVAGSGEVIPRTKLTNEYVTAYTKAQADAWLASEAANNAFDAILSAKLN